MLLQEGGGDAFLESVLAVDAQLQQLQSVSAVNRRQVPTQYHAHDTPQDTRRPSTTHPSHIAFKALNNKESAYKALNNTEYMQSVLIL